jgi:hypothetical protein
LRCKESLRKKKARQAHMKRIRSFMRRIFGGLLRGPGSRMRRQLRHSARVVVEGPPESTADSVRHQMKNLLKTAEFAAAQPDFGGQPNASRASAPHLDASATAPRDAKAA